MAKSAKVPRQATSIPPASLLPRLFSARPLAAWSFYATATTTGNVSYRRDSRARSPWEDTVRGKLHILHFSIDYFRMGTCNLTERLLLAHIHIPRTSFLPFQPPVVFFHTRLRLEPSGIHALEHSTFTAKCVHMHDAKSPLENLPHGRYRSCHETDHPFFFLVPHNFSFSYYVIWTPESVEGWRTLFSFLNDWSVPVRQLYATFDLHRSRKSPCITSTHQIFVMNLRNASIFFLSIAEGLDI